MLCIILLINKDYPNEAAAHLVVQTVRQYLEQNKDKVIYIFSFKN